MKPAVLAGSPMNKVELDFQLSPSRFSSSAPAVFEQWRMLSERARRQLKSTAFLNLPYGKKARQWLDIFASDDRGSVQLRPIHVFVHGGFWQEGIKDDFHFPAPAFVQSGWIYIAVGYSLAPTASLSQIVSEIREAVRYIKARAPDFGGDPERIVVSGHSAGGHLAACLACTDDSRHTLAGIVAISGVFDLQPIRRSYVNDAVNIEEHEVEPLSPAFLDPTPRIAVRILVGGLESPEFIRQSRLLARHWGNACASLSYETIADVDHFNILLGFTNPTSAIFRAVTGVLDSAV